ncbi:putative cyclin-B3-1-like [Hibiscus syriacus]|uniref:Cyclin-B3-1-like n=1 Tax=Hibiscus syriacus TaxID=106335 RepID=A0A6A3CW93_HIBSY|nr:uncharacterized protein LOC120157627 [Hibiscus syriacus]KAE8731469.1 putative cyclin-B3-1-like [Hibiscus syriacus]
MAFVLPNLSPSLLLLQSKTCSKEKQHFLPLVFAQTPRLSSETLSVQSTTLQGSPVSSPSLHQDKLDQSQQQRDEFYVNLGLAVRTLREDLPLLFTRDLNYDIYRDDITFLDPLNTFSGIRNYKLIFWALRFHGKILFREISLEVFRIWQPSENVILIRWNLRGVPRVPWEAKGQFQGTSRYKLDRNGKIYEHKVDNLAFNFPQQLKPAASVLDLVAACPGSPNPTFLWGPVDTYPSSWVAFYRAVRETLDREGYLLSQDGLATCS